VLVLGEDGVVRLELVLLKELGALGGRHLDVELERVRELRQEASSAPQLGSLRAR
jgi:hypothetical protein